MGIFYSDPKTNQGSPSVELGVDAKNKSGWEWAVLAAAGMAAIYEAEISAAISKYNFEYYMGIRIAGYGLSAAALTYLAYRFDLATEEFTERVRKLIPIWNKSAGILAGRTTDGETNLYIPDKARLGHVQIVGTTGRGKTESVILPWIVRDIRRGKDAILIDGKGDPELVDRIREMTAHFHPQPEIVVFDLGNPQYSCTTNPLEHGSPQQITDRIFTAFQFEEPFYKGVQLNATVGIVSLIQEVDGVDGKPGVVTFKRLQELFTNADALSSAIGKSKNDTLKTKLTRFLRLSDKDRDQFMMGLTSQMGPFADEEVSGLVNGKVAGRPYQTISEVILGGERQKIFVLLIPTLKYQQIGHQLGKILIQELGWAVGERASRRGANAPFTPVYMDEFSAFVFMGFENILNKARSSRVAFHLSHQDVADLEKVHPTFARLINTNTNVKCLLGLNDPETADFFARHIGTRMDGKLTERAENKNLLKLRKKTGDISIREVDVFKADPNDLKQYTDGMGVLHMPSSRGSITEEIQFARLTEKELTK